MSHSIVDTSAMQPDLEADVDSPPLPAHRRCVSEALRCGNHLGASPIREASTIAPHDVQRA
eukprot:8086607-Pyramimonas_sp.AAC.1